MSLIDRLTLEDKKKIGKYIDENLEINVKRTASVEKVLKEWDYCKSESLLAQIFKDKFILQREVCYTETQLDIERKLRKEQVVNTLHDLIYDAVSETVEYIWIRNLIASFSGAYLLSLGRLDQDYLADHGDVLTLESATKPPIKIHLQKGAKVIRILSKIVDYYDIDKNLFEQVRLAQSMAMNTKTLKGTMCLSIHPLDYMTMSDNDSDWSSCMSWKEEGCYRQGTIEMMNSPYVVVAYLKSKNDMNLCWNGANYEKWNNKKWRELFIVNEDCIVNVKSYPFMSDDLTMFCMNWLKELVTENIGWKYQNDCKSGDNDFLINEGYCFQTNYMYNDIAQDEHYRHFIYEGVNHKVGERSYIIYSGPFVCMACGNVGNNYDDCNDNGGTIICDGCRPTECSCCGCSLIPDIDSICFVGENEVPYCEVCYNELHTDFVTGEKLPIYDNSLLYVLDRETKELRTTMFTTYSTLRSNQKEMSDYLKAIHLYSRIESDGFGIYEAAKSYFVYEDELTEAGKNKCEEYGEKMEGRRYDFPIDINSSVETKNIESVKEIDKWERAICIRIKEIATKGVHIFNIPL